jgi:hypothetical protein
VIIAVAVVVTVLGVVLALTLGGDEKDSAKSGGGSGTRAQVTPSADTRNDEDGTRPDGSASASEDQGSTPAASGGSTPGGGTAGQDATNGTGSGAGSGAGAGKDGAAPVVLTHRGGQGYSIGLPKGWKFQTSSDAGDRFVGPDGQKLLIGWTSTPKDDPVADWRNQERFMVRSQYQRIRIEAVGYRGWNTADWEFTYVEGGTKYRTIDRGFVVDDDQGYALMYTAKAAKWHGELRKDTWRTLTKSFQPRD